MKHIIGTLLAASAVTGFTAPSALQSKGIRTLPALHMIPDANDQTTSSLQASSVLEDTATTVSEDLARKSYLDDGFVFGLEGSGLDRPKGKVAQVVLEGDDLETKSWQVAFVSGTFLCHALFALNALNGMLEVNSGNFLFTTIQAIALLFSSWVMADFGSGVLHWSVDNYGNGRTPIMGGIIAAFQGHHSAQWTITQRGFSNNVHKLCIPFGVVPMALITAVTGPCTTFFFSIFCALEILSQEFHKWSHMTKSECSWWINQLQKFGLSIGRKPHAQHHLAPYKGNYCIVSGVCNEWLDKSGFFRRLEHLVYKWNGIESNSWKLDQELKERTLRGEYSLMK